MTEYIDLFKFAAKAGSLEGYLYERKRVEPLYDWMRNIEKMYSNLPDNIKREMKDELSIVLTRILTYGENVLDQEIKTSLNNLLSSL